MHKQTGAATAAAVLGNGSVCWQHPKQVCSAAPAAFTVGDYYFYYYHHYYSYYYPTNNYHNDNSNSNDNDNATTLIPTPPPENPSILL